MSAQGKLRVVDRGYLAYCPGCQEYHLFDQRWTFNGDFDNPTFTPSMLVDKDRPDSRCHSFLMAGQWRFLDDCFHELKNQLVVMEAETEEGHDPVVRS
jgi:hypothetical protein